MISHWCMVSAWGGGGGGGDVVSYPYNNFACTILTSGNDHRVIVGTCEGSC